MCAEKRPMRKESLCSVWTISNAGLAKMRQTLSTSTAIQGSVTNKGGKSMGYFASESMSVYKKNDKGKFKLSIKSNYFCSL